MSMSTEERAKELGLEAFDTALPQSFADDVESVTGENPQGDVVWCYDGSTIFGGPVPVTEEGRDMLARYNATTPREL